MEACFHPGYGIIVRFDGQRNLWESVAETAVAMRVIGMKKQLKEEVLFTDDSTRYRQVWCAPTSASVHVALEQYCNTCEERGCKLEVVRCDSEWVTDKAKALARKKGFVFQVSAPYCQWQDGVAEQ